MTARGHKFAVTLPTANSSLTSLITRDVGNDVTLRRDDVIYGPLENEGNTKTRLPSRKAMSPRAGSIVSGYVTLEVNFPFNPQLAKTHSNST